MTSTSQRDLYVRNQNRKSFYSVGFVNPKYVAQVKAFEVRGHVKKMGRQQHLLLCLSVPRLRYIILAMAIVLHPLLKYTLLVILRN